MNLCVEVVNGEASLSERPIPTIAPTEVLIKIMVAKVNRIDLLMMEGVLNSPKDVMVPGSEFVGVVSQVGSQVDRRLSVGDRVAVEPRRSCRK